MNRRHSGSRSRTSSTSSVKNAFNLAMLSSWRRSNTALSTSSHHTWSRQCEGHRATYTAQIETYVASQHGSNGISLTRHSTKSSQTFSFGAYEHVILCVAVSVAIATLFRTVKHANVRTSSLITLDDCFDWWRFFVCYFVFFVIYLARSIKFNTALLLILHTCARCRVCMVESRPSRRPW